MFSTDLSTRAYGGFAVVAFRGELDLADAATVTAALTAVAARDPLIIVDLVGLEFIDLSGAMALARGRRQARRAGGDLVLAAVQRKVIRALAIIRLNEGFSVYATVEEAAGEAGQFRERAMPVQQRPRPASRPMPDQWPGTHDRLARHSSRLPSVPAPATCRLPFRPAAAAPEAPAGHRSLAPEPEHPGTLHRVLHWSVADGRHHQAARFRGEA